MLVCAQCMCVYFLLTHWIFIQAGDTTQTVKSKITQDYQSRLVKHLWVRENYCFVYVIMRTWFTAFVYICVDLSNHLSSKYIKQVSALYCVLSVCLCLSKSASTFVWVRSLCCTCHVGLGGTENFYLRLLWWDGHAIIANIAMSGLISQIIDIIRVNCAKLIEMCTWSTFYFCCSYFISFPKH